MNAGITATVLLDFPIGYISYMLGIRGTVLIGLVIVIYLEAAIFQGYRGGSWKEAISHSTRINLASSLLGYAASYWMYELADLGMFAYEYGPDHYADSIEYIEFMLYTDNLVPGYPTAVIFLVLSFLISILCEGLLYERLAAPQPADYSWFLIVAANGASYALLFSVYLWRQFLPLLFEGIVIAIYHWPISLALLILVMPFPRKWIWRGLVALGSRFGS